MITGEQVKAARKLLGWSQMLLALEASLDQTTVAKFERGESRPYSALPRSSAPLNELASSLPKVCQA
jgi:transcriptional regulator with XRE-family HTH domain